MRSLCLAPAMGQGRANIYIIYFLIDQGLSSNAEEQYQYRLYGGYLVAMVCYIGSIIPNAG